MTTATYSQFIFSADPEFFATALAELKQVDSQLQLLQKLNPGVGLVESQLDELSFFTILELAQPVFVRHIFPVQATLHLENDEGDPERIAVAVVRSPGVKLIKKNAAFAAQVRLLHSLPEEATETTLAPTDKRPYTPFAVKEKIVELVVAKSRGVENIKEPRIVISVVCVGDEAYFGVSKPEQNLSSWPGGERRFARLPEMVSRAEFKLLEALETFGVALPESGTALDLGAAPGGWTRLLLENGLRVVAVDPANLHSSLEGQPRLEHFRGYTENYLELARSHRRIFDVICNDMRMDARQAAQLMLQASDFLSPKGFALTSLKLPHETARMHPLKIMNEALEIMGRGYSEVRARQLFHNRQEVTVFLRK